MKDCSCNCHEDPSIKEALERRERIRKEKEDAKNFLYSNPANQPLQGNNLEYALLLLNKHPNRDEKIGVGVKDIIPVGSRLWKNQRQFKIVRTDESEDFFSYVKCIEGRVANPRRDFYNACRRAVERSMQDFKYTRKKKEGKKFTVDHEAPWYFATILTEFCKTRKFDFEKIEYFEGCFKDKILEEEFSKYHKARARYRLITIEEQIYENSFIVKEAGLEL